MAIIKCKMCGGDVEIAADKTFGTCEYCGSTMTFPKVDDEQRAAAFNRGNHFRRIGEFDKALQVYERIVREDENDAEAHWCCALCRFGIEYVEDPTTYEWLPTCHRASFDSFLEDVDYLAAVEHSDGITKKQYVRDGAKIAEVQRGILATSQNEEPYDVFICYKETDENGDRTRDSAMAQDIYYQLTEQGRRVFFARITLEDKVGAEYEPYIFAALHSAKVMVVVGTSAEHLNAVWVKNEWSRFLAMMKHDRNKILLPCYRDMDPYDLPDQLGVLQSYDMSKIGFIQDLTRGISKVLDADKQPEQVKETVVVQQTGGSNSEALLKRGYMALEDGEWEQADSFFEEVLNQNAECSDAYLGKVLAEEKTSGLNQLVELRQQKTGATNTKKLHISVDQMHIADIAHQCTVPNFLEESEITSLYQAPKGYESVLESTKQQLHAEKDFWAGYSNMTRALRFANPNEKEKIQKALGAIYAKIEQRIQSAEEQEIIARKAAEKAYEKQLKETDEKVRQLNQKARTRRQQEYEQCCRLLESDEIVSIETALHGFGTMIDYLDSKQNAEKCKYRISELEEKRRKQQEEKEEKIKQQKKKRSKMRATAMSVVVSVVILIMVTVYVIIPGFKYHAAVELLQMRKYEDAIIAFEELEEYKGGKIFHGKARNEKVKAERIATNQKNYKEAERLEASGEIEKAAIAFAKLEDFEDAYARSDALWNKIPLRETISAYGVYTIGLKDDGTVVACGKNVGGRCDVSEWTDIVSVSAGLSFSAGVGKDGRVVTAGDIGSGQGNVSEWENIVFACAGDKHIVGLRRDGQVEAAGNNKYGQCDVFDWSDIIYVSAGKSHTVGLKSDGTVVAVGDNYDGRCNVSAWTDIISISAGASNTVGVRRDGSVVAVGGNHDGQCDVSAWNDIIAVSASKQHTVGLKSDGTVVAVGNNENGQCDIADWTDIVAISAGDYHTVGLRSDGTMVAAGENFDDRCNVTDWVNMKLEKTKS